MSERPLVSCLLATHNHGRFLARSLDSVLGQTYPAERIEIVVVDDGSTDDTPQVIAPYRDRVTAIRTPNRGLRATVNRLLAEARGELITFQSGDDVWLPDRLERQVAEMERRPELGLLYADMRVIDEHDATVSDSYWRMHDVTPVRGRPVARLMRGNVVSGGTLMFRASLLPHVLPMPECAPWEDWWTALRVACVAEIDFLDAAVFGYRRHGANMNLGADGARAVAIAAAELPFRRWMLTDLESGLVDAAGWVGAAQEWLSALHYVAAGQGRDVAAVVGAETRAWDAAATAAGRAGERFAAGDLTGAAREAVRAVGHDPFSPHAAAALARLQAALGDGAHANGAQADGADAGGELRGFVTAADGGELLERPELLHAYAAAFAGHGAATLVVPVPEDRVPALAAGLGGAERRSGEIDVVAAPVPAGVSLADTAELAGRAHAVLSARPPSAPFLTHPHASGGDVARLRALADARTGA